MTDLNALLAQRMNIDAQIAQQKLAAVQQVRDFMAVCGVTMEDLNSGNHKGAKRPVKYRDEAGNTWTGVGQRPRWLRARLLAGATLAEFTVTR